MFSGTTQSESARAHQHYDRRPSYTSSQHQPYSHPPRPSAELPRPLEPRPTHHLQSSLSETSTIQRHPDTYRVTHIGTSDHRTQGQNLPGLRDILTPAPQSSGPSGYTTTWAPASGTPSGHAGGDGFYHHGGLHPPLALYPPSDLSSAYHSQPPRRLELPILETSPVGRQLPQSLPVSPFTTYPEARNYNEASADRARQASTTSYMGNGVHSPYTSGAEEVSYRNTGPPYERMPSSAAMAAAGIESQRKYLGVKELAGEGTFHLYEGGFRIPTHVDGEQVNPAWGLTKANKPRKRLALACLDCREKKIKCEPGTNSCLQCEKAKRHCRRAPLQQTPSENGGPQSWQQSNTNSPVRKGVSDPTPTREPDVDAVIKRRTREDTTPPNIPSKKQRSTSPANAASDGLRALGQSVMNGTAPRTVGVSHATEDSERTLTWDEDPYAVDPETTLYLLDLFFTHINDATYTLFPRHTFTRWVKTRSEKCQQERLVLYAVLATGSIFADDRYTGFGKRCAQIATDAATHGVGSFNLCSVQTRLLLALYHLAIGKYEAAWDYAGWALRASTSTQLRMQIDKDCEDDATSSLPPRIQFGFSSTQYAECLRRTFWSVFMMDRFQDGTLCGVDVRDIFLRLPCSEEAYEQSHRSKAPFFNNGIVDAVQTILTPADEICPMAWLTLIAAIWGDVLNVTNRTVYRGESAYRDAYERFYSETHTALQGWLSRLPEHLHYSEANIDRSIQGGYAGVFVSMHALYHFILIRMNRYVRHSVMPDVIRRNIRAAHIHANALLSMTAALQAPRRDSASHAIGQSSGFVASTPFLGQAVVSAIDVIGAGGLESKIRSTLDAIESGVGCLRELSRYWSSARDQYKESEKRYYQIKAILARPQLSRNGAWLGREWGIKDRMEQDFKLEDDCIYADDGRGDGYTRTYFDALQDSANEGRPGSGSLRLV